MQEWDEEQKAKFGPGIFEGAWDDMKQEEMAKWEEQSRLESSLEGSQIELEGLLASLEASTKPPGSFLEASSAQSAASPESCAR